MYLDSPHDRLHIGNLEIMCRYTLTQNLSLKLKIYAFQLKSNYWIRLYLTALPINCSKHYLLFQKLEVVFVCFNQFEWRDLQCPGFFSPRLNNQRFLLSYQRLLAYFFTYCVKYETVSSNMYISCVNCVFWLLGLFNA